MPFSHPFLLLLLFLLILNAVSMHQLDLAAVWSSSYSLLAKCKSSWTQTLSTRAARKSLKTRGLSSYSISCRGEEVMKQTSLKPMSTITLCLHSAPKRFSFYKPMKHGVERSRHSSTGLWMCVQGRQSQTQRAQRVCKVSSHPRPAAHHDFSSPHLNLNVISLPF